MDWGAGGASGTDTRISPFSAEKWIYCTPLLREKNLRQTSREHTVLWRQVGPSCSESQQAFLPCDVSDIKTRFTPRVEDLQELALELGIVSHVIFHQVRFILEQQRRAHLGEVMTLRARWLWSRCWAARRGHSTHPVCDTVELARPLLTHGNSQTPLHPPSAA